MFAVSIFAVSFDFGGNWEFDVGNIDCGDGNVGFEYIDVDWIGGCCKSSNGYIDFTVCDAGGGADGADGWTAGGADGIEDKNELLIFILIKYDYYNIEKKIT